MNRNDEQLDKLLLRWKVEASPRPDLTSKVWRRLAEREERDPLGRLSGWFSGFSEGLLLRPAFAAALVILALLGGIGVAEWRLARQSTGDPGQWERVYLTSINPVAMAGNGAVHQHHQAPSR